MNTLSSVSKQSGAKHQKAAPTSWIFMGLCGMHK